jgi:uncharacterized iron-regulated membrane protein
MPRSRKFVSAVVVMVTLNMLGASLVMASQETPDVSAAPAVASPTQASPQGSSAKSEAAAQESSKMICRQTAPIGTRIAKKTCKTAADWEEIRKMGSEAARTGTEQGRICGDNCAAPGG